MSPTYACHLQQAHMQSTLSSDGDTDCIPTLPPPNPYPTPAMKSWSMIRTCWQVQIMRGESPKSYLRVTRGTSDLLKSHLRGHFFGRDRCAIGRGLTLPQTLVPSAKSSDSTEYVYLTMFSLFVCLILMMSLCMISWHFQIYHIISITYVVMLYKRTNNWCIYMLYCNLFRT